MQLYEERSPFAQNWERLCSDSLAYNTAPDIALTAVRPNLPSVQDRPRFGYPLKQERELSIRQVIDVPRFYQDRRFDTSGGPGSFQAAERNVSESIGW